MLTISNISKIQGGELLFSQGSFHINAGEKVGLVGPNGAGKTTLFRLIMGEDQLDEGEIGKSDKWKIAYFSQNVGEMKGKTALEEVMEADSQINQLRRKLSEYEQILSDPGLDIDRMNVVLEKMGDVQAQFEKRDGYGIENRAEEILTGLGIVPKDHGKKVEDFSGGWKMRIALAKVLAIYPDLILMDEPTNYLDLETILWLEEWLKNFSGAVFMTTHDRNFMNNVANKIIEISQGKIFSYTGNYDFYLQEKEIRLRNLKAMAQRQRDNLAKEEEFIAQFKARASHAAQVQSRVKKLSKIERVVVPSEDEEISFQFADPPRGSDDVVVIKNLSKSFKNSKGEEILVFENLSMIVNRLEKIAVVGVNGAGKSTLLKCITGELLASQGSVKLGPSIKMGYFSQYSCERLNPENTVFNELRETFQEESDGYLRNLLAAFLFKGDDVNKKIKYLSGGEKSRVVLSIILSQKNNFLVLDEPTNHLDIKSRELLLKALRSFQGTIVFVSHDRVFLDELAQKVVEIDKNQVRLYPGNYHYYLGKKSRT
jgi:ATP-binding cassette subfamily F protein 3